MAKRTFKFAVEKDRQEGKVTPAGLRDRMNEWVDDYKKVESMIVLYEHEGELTVAWSDQPPQKLFGNLAYANAVLIRELQERAEE